MVQQKQKLKSDVTSHWGSGERMMSRPKTSLVPSGFTNMWVHIPQSIAQKMAERQVYGL